MSENISVEEVCRLLETLDEWEEVALQLGLSDQMIQEIRELSGGNSVRRKAMVSKWIQCEELEPSWSKLEKALVSANQEASASKIRASLHAPKPGITTDSAPSPCFSDTSYSETEIENFLSTVDNKTFKEDDWNVVFVECCSLAAKWEQLSACLGLAKANIDSIRESRSRDSAGCWSEALSQWIKQNYSTQRFGLPSWRSLLKAVAVVDKRLVKELATKHPSEMLQVPSAVVQSPASPQSPEKSAQSMDMIRSNVGKIKALFSALVLKVQSALQSQSDVSNVRQFLITFFKCDFPDTSDLKKLFTTITLSDLWDYQHYNPLEQLMEHFLPGNQELESLMKAYKACLSGFYLTTKLIDYIDYKNLSTDDSDEECDQPSPKLTTKQYRKIKVVLQLERKVSQLSLEYVVKLWESFAEEYEIPSLTAVIDRIVAGSLEVTWRVPQHIADAILPRSKFFRSHGIVLVFIDDVILYDEKQMIDYERSFLKLFQEDVADISQFSYFLKQGVDPDIYDNDGSHPLWYASNGNRADLVELLLEFHATVDLATNDDLGETALVAAVNRGHTHIADILVRNGANVNYWDKKGQSVLWIASFYGHTEIVLLLLRHHAEVDLPTDNEFGETALFAACSQGHYDPAALLIENRADVNYLSKQGLTPMYFASKHNRVRLVQLLLAHGADINKGVQSPLYTASDVGNMEMVQLLVHHHAAIDQPCDDEYAATPLIAACGENKLEVAQFLIENTANINYQTKKGWSPLQTACDRGNTDIAKLLILSNANIELKNKEGRTALMVASWRGYVAIVMELIRAGAKTDNQDQEGLTSLMLSTQNGHDNVAEALLNANADPNIAENTIGWTALHFAAKSGNFLIIKLLLTKGADTELRDKNGLTAVEICEDEDACDELRRHTISQNQTNTQPTEKEHEEQQDSRETTKAQTQDNKQDSETTEETNVDDRPSSDKGKVTEDQRKLVKKSYQKLLRIFDVLEDSLLTGRKEKKLHQQREASNIAEANQQLLLQNTN